MPWLGRFESIINKLRNFANKYGYEMYAVGGFVRDLLLGKEPKDLDVLVLVNSVKKLEDAIYKLVVEYNLHPPILVGKAFGVYKVIIDGEEIDFVPPRKEYYFENSRKPVVSIGTLDDDYFRRDFTINAIYLRLNDMKLVDPGGGVEDIKDKIIRVTNSENPDTVFSEDPLRILRAVRFACVLGFEIDPETKEAMKRNVKRLEIVSAERITEEFKKILLSQSPSKGIELLREIGALDLILPELTKTIGVEQDKAHHTTDVYTHTLRTLDLVPPDLVLRLSALLHDLGKPETKSVINGIIHFFEHEDVSAELAEGILKRLRFPNDIINKVVTYIKHHMRPHQYTSTWTDSAIRRLIRDLGEYVESIVEFAKQDHLSDAPQPSLEKYDELLTRIRTLKNKEEPKYQSILDGHEIMELVGYHKAGPWIRLIKDHLSDKLTENPNMTKEEAKQEVLRFIEEYKKRTGQDIYEYRGFGVVKSVYQRSAEVGTETMGKVLKDTIILLDNKPVIIQDKDGALTLLTYFKYCSDAIEKFGDQSNPVLRWLKWHLDRFYEITLTDEKLQLLRTIIQKTKDSLPYKMPGLAEQVLKWLE